MSFISWLKDKLGGGSVQVGDFGEYAEEYAGLVGDVCYREMAFWSAVNVAANAVSKCEFKTFSKGKEVKDREYYLWNIEPNKNQNSSAFIHDWITKLFRKNECLIIEHGGQLLVADDFVRTPYALYDDVFTEVTVKDFTFNRSFVQSEVLYYKLSETDMKKVTDALYASYSKLIAYSMNAFRKSKGTKGIFKYETLPTAGTDERAAFDALINEKIGKWLSGDNAALPLGKGQDWKELTQKTYSSENSRDIRAMIDDVSDFTAKSIGIHPALLRGDVQNVNDALDYTLTFCVDPLVDMLAEEINRKRNGYDAFSRGTYLTIDTRTVKHIDLLSASNAVDKLIASGAFCINDIRKLVGDTVIDEPWAWKHYITKNYTDVENMQGLGEGI